MGSTQVYRRFEIGLSGPSSGNPFREVNLSAEFTLGHRTVSVRGFYDGEGSYRVRFMPDEPGTWSYVTHSDAAELDTKSGSFHVEPAAGCPAGSTSAAGGSLVHGPVQAVGSGFRHTDGTPYVPVGTTCYAWAHQPTALRDQTVETLAGGPFNKIRMCAFPKHYRYNRNEPEHFVFPGSIEQGFDFERFNPEFFALFEAELDRLADLGVEADIILFHPYDRWGFQSMTAETEEFYLRYVVARWASFANVWWSMANEWDFMKTKTIQDFHRYFRTVQREDPYGHLRSVHNGHVFYDHALPWVTHSSIQRSDTERSGEWLTQWGKPVVIDECCYEGDIREGWGNISAQELLRRQWTAVVNGGWPGAHGETYYNDDEVLWWAKGGRLTGEAPERIAFMRMILEDAPVADLKTVRKNWDLVALCAGDEYLLFYLGFQQASWKNIALPDGRRYRAEVIDTWNMTVTPLDGRYSGDATIPLPGREYIAIRLRAD